MQEEGNELSQWVLLQRKLCQLRMALVGVLGTMVRDCLGLFVGFIRTAYDCLQGGLGLLRIVCLGLIKIND